MRGPLLAMVALSWAGCDPGPKPAPAEVCSQAEGLELYRKRIEPLLSEERASTCSQCHLSGAELSLFAAGSPCGAMERLIQSGEVDLDDPPQSKVLGRIRRATPGNALITQAVVDEELAGFQAWIGWSATCHEWACVEQDDLGGPPPDPVAPPQTAHGPLGLCEPEAMEALFEERVFSHKGRCSHCHTVCQEDYPAPCWLDESFDDDVEGSRRAASTRTMFNLLGIGAIRRDRPDVSPYLLKPLPEEHGGTPHLGGDKFQGKADWTYQDFLVFAERYADCWHGREPRTPLVRIDSPIQHKNRRGDEPYTLHGGADDPQDGALSGDALVWRLALEDGRESGLELGRGAGPFEATLPLGDHVVELTATDSDGDVGRRQVHVHVKPIDPDG